jgi:hypothetical protein
MHPIIDNLILGPLKYLKKKKINQIKIERKKRRKIIKEEKKQLGVELRRNIEKKVRIG